MSNVIALPRPGKTSPANQKGKVTPRRPKNLAVRSREHLLPAEVAKLITAAGKSGRYSQRDKALVMLMYRHALRVTEAVSLRWEQVDMERGELHVTRAKRGTPSTHPLRGPELRELRELRRQWPSSAYLFCSERGERTAPMTTSNVRKMLTRLGKLTGLPHLHPHQLRHSLGYYLAAKGEDTRGIAHYMGHVSLQHTARYTALSPERFKSFFRD